MVSHGGKKRLDKSSVRITCFFLFTTFDSIIFKVNWELILAILPFNGQNFHLFNINPLTQKYLSVPSLGIGTPRGQADTPLPTLVTGQVTGESKTKLTLMWHWGMHLRLVCRDMTQVTRATCRQRGGSWSRSDQQRHNSNGGSWSFSTPLDLLAIKETPGTFKKLINTHWETFW